MTRGMTGLREWLRPPRNLLILFLLVVCVPAATLILLGLRLLDQDRALAKQRQLELLDRAADYGVRAVEQDLAARSKRLASGTCTQADVSDDAICVTFKPGDRIETLPPGSIPYYPVAAKLQETPVEPFQELELYEFRDPIALRKALDISLKLKTANDPAIRAGALLRQARILRKLNRTTEALASFDELSRITSIAINGEPADLAARRARCAIFESESRTAELRREASSILIDLQSGKWQLDRDTFLHIQEKLNAWVGSRPQAAPFADAVDWLYTKSINGPSAGTYALHSSGTVVTVLWSFGNGHDTAFITGPKFVESHWLEPFRKTANPAQAYIAGIGTAVSPDEPKVQRSAADSGLPWTVLVTSRNGTGEPQEFAERRRNLVAGLGILILLIAAGSYFIWRAVHRELAVAQLQSDFVSAVSHEFRTPLTALRQFNELLTEEDGPTLEKRRTFYHAQKRATDRLHRLVESLLDFRRMEAGRYPYNFEPLDAASLAHDVAQEFNREVSGLGFVVDCNADSGDHRISADAEALSRALWNLLDNSVKYSGSSRNVEVHVSRANGKVSIGVHDHGIGVPPEEQESIFQKFVRGAASTSGGIRGTGLGLAMVRHIVQSHGGNVGVQSIEGKGSTFTIVLPAGSEAEIK